MNTINKKISESLHWMFGQSVFIKIGAREVHHMPIDEVLSIAHAHAMTPGNVQHILHLLSLAIMGYGPLTGFIDIAGLYEQVPAHFNKQKETEQIQFIHEAVRARQHHHETVLSRFSFANPYVICWLPESEARVLEQA